MPNSREGINAAFALLAPLLAEHPLPCEDGSTRIAAVDEFMLMNGAGELVLEFKHQVTRNYLYVHRITDDGTARLEVPCTDDPWQRGRFDV